MLVLLFALARLGGILVPFVGIKVIDMILTLFGWV